MALALPGHARIPKLRNKMGLDVAVQALQMYRQRTKKLDVILLSRFAEMNRVRKVMTPYVEALL